MTEYDENKLTSMEQKVLDHISNIIGRETNWNEFTEKLEDNLQDVINAVAGSENLHFFAFTPSFQKRGISKDKSLNAVLELGYPGLGKIFFYPPGNVQAEHQRVLVF